jgi:hypothetical protein
MHVVCAVCCIAQRFRVILSYLIIHRPAYDLPYPFGQLTLVIDPDFGNAFALEVNCEGLAVNRFKQPPAQK